MIDDIEIAVTYTIKRNYKEVLHWVDRYTQCNVCNSLFRLFEYEYGTYGKRGFRYDKK